MPKRLGFNLLYIRPGYMGGTVRYAYELLKYIAKTNDFAIKIYIQKNVLPADDPILNSIPKQEFSIKGGLFGRIITEHLILPTIAQKDQIELMFSPGFVSPLLGKFKKAVTIHDLYYKKFPQFVRFWQRQYWKIFIPLSLKQSDCIITVSENTKQDLLTSFSNITHKVHCIHLGVTVNNLPPTIPKEPFCLVVGNITPNKNITTVIKAMAKLPIKLIIAGNDRFNLLAKALPTKTPNIELRENLNDTELSKLYSQALCLIQASFYEGFGLPVLEAMASGCPVIASNIPVFKEIGANNVLYFDPNSCEDLATKIDAIYQNTNLREMLKIQGKQQARLFSWEKTGQSTAQLFI